MRDKKQLEKRWSHVLDNYKRSIELEKINYDNYYANNIRKCNYIGSILSGYARCFSSLGILEYLLYRNIIVFKNNQIKALQILRQAFDEENILQSWINMRTYKNLFLGLSAGEINLTKEYAKKMHTPAKNDLEPASPFSLNLGYTLKYYVLEDLVAAQPYLNNFKVECTKKGNTNFQGYATVFEAITEQDVAKANHGFTVINHDHIKECKGGGHGYFKGTVLEDLNTWGLGMANLCRYYGMDVQIDHPLIPAELLIEVRKVGGSI